MDARFIKKRATLLNQVVITSLSLGFVLTIPVNADDDDIIAEDCFLYGVHDAGLNDSQLIGIKGTQSFPIGGLYPGYDLEGLDVNPNGELYASSGDDADEGHPAGHLYKIDPSKADDSTQFITSLGDIEIHFSRFSDAPVEMVKNKEVSALSFRPDGSLWGWVEECGLIEIDKNTGYAELYFLAPSYDICVYADPSSYTSHIEDISWNNAGDTIYAVEQDRVWAYHFDTETITLASSLEVSHSVEAIETMPDDTLLIGLNGSTLLGNLNLRTDELITTKLKANIFYDIEALAWSCPIGFDGQLPDVPPPPVEEPEVCGTDWYYAADPINDSSGDSPETSSIIVGNTYYEVYGAAVKLDDDTVTVAINTRLPLGGVNYGVAWSDFFIDFGGKLYGVRFDSKNDTTYPVGLYEVTQVDSLTKSNHGHTTFSSYSSYIKTQGGTPVLGDLSILDNGYFRNDDKMPTTIKVGTKVADIQMLDVAQLATKGLDFATHLSLSPSRYTPTTPYSSTNKKPANELGEYTFGFSFPRQVNMSDSFIAYVFTECGNDGIAMVSSLPSCEAPASIDETAPIVEEPVPPVVEEPTPPVVEEPAPPVVEEPAPPVVEEPAPPVVEEPAPPVVEEPAPPVVEEPAPPVVEEPAPPVVEEPTPPVVEEPAPPVVEEPIVAEQCGADWHYVIDPINDSSGDSPETTKNLVGNTYYEVYGAAIKLDEETVTIAINTRLPLGGGGNYSTVAWSDLFIDFGGKLYGVRFDSKNDTAYPVGLYEVSQTSSLTKSNYGYKNFTAYESHIRGAGGTPSLGDLPILNNGYFRNDDPMPTTIKTGVKVADIQMLDMATLTTQGLDFATNLGLAPSRYTPATPYSKTNKKPANELGEYTFGFSFPRQANMIGDFTAYVFTECGNDGVAMVSTLPSCESPIVEEPAVDEPTTTEVTHEQVVVALNDNKDSKYGFTLVSHIGNTWTYEVEELKGRDLSHWGLGIGSCLNKISSSSPSGAEIGIDGSTGFNSIKWNTGSGFSKGQFSFTLNGNYPEAQVSVLAKAGTSSNTIPITGPKCD